MTSTDSNSHLLVPSLSAAMLRFLNYIACALSSGRIVHYQTPSLRSCVVTVPAQLLFDAGQAGLGCKIWPRRGDGSTITALTSLAAISPTPMIHSGFRFATIERR